MFETSIAGSLPKPSWLAEPNKLWAPWRLAGDELAAGKRDATLVVLKEQEDAGIDIVTEGEQSRQHFVHGFLEAVEGIDFNRKVEMGIRNDRYKAMVPTVVSALRLRGRVHATEARLARAHTTRKLKFTLPGPMTIADTVADAHYGDRVKMAMAFADLLNAEARALAADGGPHLLRLRHQGQHRLEGDARRRMAAIRGDLSGALGKPHRPGIGRVPQLACADEPPRAARRQGRAGRRDRCGDR